MLRITVIEEPPGARTLRLEGRLVGPCVDELRRLGQDLLKVGSTPSLDLQDVLFVDEDGLDLLDDLIAHGAHITSCAPLVAEQLRGRKS